MRDEGGRGGILRALAAVLALTLLLVGAVALKGRAKGDDAGSSTGSQGGAEGTPESTSPASAVSTATTDAATDPSTPAPGTASSGASVSPSSPGQQQPSTDALNPKRGPGAVLVFSPDTAPLLPAGSSALDYVTQYYELLLQRDYEAASALVPKEDPAQGVADFLGLLAGYEPEGYFVTDVTDVPGGQTVNALQFGSDNRSWTTTWQFVDTARGRVLKDVTYALPDGGACH